MPAAAIGPDVPQGLTLGQVWDLVNYLLSLSGRSPSEGWSTANPFMEDGIGARPANHMRRQFSTAQPSTVWRLS